MEPYIYALICSINGVFGWLLMMFFIKENQPVFKNKKNKIKYYFILSITSFAFFSLTATFMLKLPLLTNKLYKSICLLSTSFFGTVMFVLVCIQDVEFNRFYSKNKVNKFLCYFVIFFSLFIISYFVLDI